MPAARQLFALVFALLCFLLVLPPAAAAQVEAGRHFSIAAVPAAAEPAPSPSVVDRRSFRLETRKTLLPAQRTGSRDSLANGTLIGAVIGAATAGVFGAVLCNALQEPGDPSCLSGTLRVAAFGAAIGAGAGLAVDAARSRDGGVRVSVGIRF